MYNIILIADNETDLMGFPVEEYTSASEVSPEENITGENTEMSFVAGKLLVSFGALIVCIVLFLAFVLLFKKKLSKRDSLDEYDEYDEQAEEEGTEMQEQNRIPTTLNTPSSVKQCIRTFLENTRNL